MERLAKPVIEVIFAEKKMLNCLKIKEKSDMREVHKR